MISPNDIIQKVTGEGTRSSMAGLALGEGVALHSLLTHGNERTGKQYQAVSLGLKRSHSSDGFHTCPFLSNLTECI